MEKLRSAAKELHKKIKLIAQEISSKEKEISKLRQANSQLIEQNLEKVRKPKSLEVQRNQIVKIDVEILELKIVEKSLQEKLTQADDAIKTAKLKDALAELQTLSQKQLSKIRHMKDLLLTVDESLRELEGMVGKGGALYGLLQLLWNNQKALQYVDLNLFLKDWSSSNVNLKPPENIALRMQQSNARIFGLWNQLQALATGSRTIPSVKLPKPANRSPLDKNQIRTMEAGAEAKKVREKPVTPFMQSFPQAPPG